LPKPPSEPQAQHLAVQAPAVAQDYLADDSAIAVDSALSNGHGLAVCQVAELLARTVAERLISLGCINTVQSDAQ
jgi:hypothetical protein